MTIEEMKEMLHFREITSKHNNMIIVSNDSNELINAIPDLTGISFPDNNIDIEDAINIKIDLAEIALKDVLTYALNYLKNLKLVDVSFDYILPFKNSFSLNAFATVLHDYSRVVQLIFYNMEELSTEEQMLFNELYYYTSSYFSSVAITKDDFKTYSLTQDRVINEGEHYLTYNITKSYTLNKTEETH